MNEARIARWSRYLIYFTLAVLPLERIPSWELAGMTVRLSQIVGMILIAINLPLIWRSRAQLLRGPWRWLAVFWLVCVLSATMAMPLKHSLMVTAFTGFVGLLAWVISLRFERDKLAVYVSILVISALGACAFGLYQFFGDLLGLPVHWTGLRPQYAKEVFGFPRIQSTGLEPLYFGNFLLIPASLLVLAVVWGWQRRNAAVALTILATTVWLTVSRGAMVALAVAMIIGLMTALWRRRWVGVASIVAAGVVSMALALGLLYLGTHYVNKVDKTGGTPQTTHAIENFSNQTKNVSTGESAEGRSVTRQLAWRAFLTHPVLGIGPGAFGAYAAREMPERFSGEGAIVNNETLEILAETGLAGAVSLLAFVLGIMWAAIKSAGQVVRDRIWTYGLILALFAIAMQYQTFSTLYITHVWVALGLLAGIVATAKSDKAQA